MLLECNSGVSRASLIAVDPEIMHGTPCFAGTRVPVKSIFDWLERGHSVEEFLENFPSVSREQVNAVLRLACEKLLEAEGRA